MDDIERGYLKWFCICEQWDSFIVKGWREGSWFLTNKMCVFNLIITK